jgi:hypothetical protein
MHWFALGLALPVALGIIAIGTQYVAIGRYTQLRPATS